MASGFLELIFPSFVAGLLTFLAPCTLPLVPGYLGFIAGVSLEDLKDPEKAHKARWKIVRNGLLYILGFSLVFVFLGSLFGLGGAALVQYRLWLSRIGGIFVIVFGLYMMHVLNLPMLNMTTLEGKIKSIKGLKPGTPLSSFVFGTAFAFGWTPCVGPILGSVLILASTSATVWQGTVLLTVFSLGLAVPFFLIALGIGQATQYIKKISKYLNTVSVIGGAFLVFIGILLITNSLGLWTAWFFRVFGFINYGGLLDFL